MTANLRAHRTGWRDVVQQQITTAHGRGRANVPLLRASLVAADEELATPSTDLAALLQPAVFNCKPFSAIQLIYFSFAPPS
eukprot:1999377-Pleurochrysis_carterae.AAC.7